MLDEADSLLRNRRQARASWELSQVNELLVQMESFDGLFFCSTNLMSELDQASLRRFALKIGFEYMNATQCIEMLKQESHGRVLKRHQERIATMRYLAPGDFATVNKRLTIFGIETTADVMLHELHEEMRVNDGAAERSPIGFCLAGER